MTVHQCSYEDVYDPETGEWSTVWIDCGSPSCPTSVFYEGGGRAEETNKNQKGETYEP